MGKEQLTLHTTKGICYDRVRGDKTLVCLRLPTEPCIRVRTRRLT